MLVLPTFPLESKARNAIACSPETGHGQVQNITLPRAVSNAVFGKNALPEAPPLTLTSARLIRLVRSSASKMARTLVSLTCGAPADRIAGGVVSISTGSLIRSPESA